MKKITKRYISTKVVDAAALEKESFIATITAIKDEAQRRNVEITDSDIANVLNITPEEFRSYYKNDHAPEDLFLLLRSKYNDFIGNTTHHRIVYEMILPDPEDFEDSE